MKALISLALALAFIFSFANVTQARTVTVIGSHTAQLVNNNSTADNDMNWKLVVIIIVIIICILLWLLFRPKEKEKKKGAPEKRPLGMYEGWMMVWIDAENVYPGVIGEANMKLTYGNAAIYETDEGEVIAESIPESYRKTYYQPWGGQRKCNPILAPELVQAKAHSQGYDIAWCDGTDQFLEMAHLPKPSLKKILQEQPWKRSKELERLAGMLQIEPKPEEG